MKKQLVKLGLGIVFLAYLGSCVPDAEQPVLLESAPHDLIPLAKEFFEAEKPNQASIHARLHQNLEVYPKWEDAKTYGGGEMVIVPAYRSVRATYAEGYLRRFVFELDQSGNVTRGGILELAGNSTEFLLENEETLISGFLNGIKSSILTYVWSDFGFSSVETVQADGKEVTRSVDRLLNAKRGKESFSMMNCIDWYWVYSVDGEVVYEEFSHTTCMDASCDENTELACLDDGLGGSDGGGESDFDLNCSDLMDTHGQNYEDINSFEFYNSGLDYYDIIEQRPNLGWDFTQSQWGGPQIRYISDPLNLAIKIDLRHMLIIGAMGRAAGNSVEVIQGIRGLDSAYDYQDYYSNELGYKFFEEYGDAIDENPYLFVTYLKQFLLSSMYRNEISNPNRCVTSSQGRYEN